MNEQEHNVKIGRLNKKISRLKVQRDYWKKQHDHYAKVISLQPYLETRYKSYEERVRAQDHVKILEKRVKEQEILIRILVDESPLKHYEIDALYSELVKREYKKLNESLRK